MKQFKSYRHQVWYMLLYSWDLAGGATSGYTETGQASSKSISKLHAAFAIKRKHLDVAVHGHLTRLKHSWKVVQGLNRYEVCNRHLHSHGLTAVR